MAIERFIVSRQVLYKYSKYEWIVFLSDSTYWADNYEKLQHWCVSNQSMIEGSVVYVPDDKTLGLFVLSWS